MAEVIEVEVIEVEVLKNEVVERTPEYVVLRASNSNQTCIIDADKYDEVKRHKWYHNAAIGYFHSSINRLNTYLHHFVFQKPERPNCVDHIDLDKTNNRVNNLQVVSYRVNLQRRAPFKNRRYKGVYNVRERYIAKIHDNDGRYIYLGIYDTAEEAAERFNQEALRLRGPQAIINVL